MKTYKRNYSNGRFARETSYKKDYAGQMIAMFIVASIVLLVGLGVREVGRYLVSEAKSSWARVVENQKELQDLAWEVATQHMPVVYASEPLPYVPEVLKNKQDYQWYLGTLVHGALYDEIVKVIDCENTEWLADKQSNMRYTRNHPEWGVKRGDREMSYGLAQYHTADPTVKVTREQAIDPKFALKKMAEDFKKGKAGNWTCHGLIK